MCNYCVFAQFKTGTFLMN